MLQEVLCLTAHSSIKSVAAHLRRDFSILIYIKVKKEEKHGIHTSRPQDNK